MLNKPKKSQQLDFQKDCLRNLNFLKQLEQRELKNLDFNKAEYEYFTKNCNFTDRQKEILDLRRKGLSIVSISMRLYLSERTINREIKRIKNKILKVI